MRKLLKKIQGNNDRLAYMFFQEVIIKSAITDEFYYHFDDFVFLLGHENIYLRIRGFALCCAQARWDEQGKIKKVLPKLLGFLKDDNPMVAKQCLGIFEEVVLYRPELHKILRTEFQNMDLTKYSDIMAVKIQKELEQLIDIMK